MVRKRNTKTKKPVIYAFIDSQNLNLGVKSQGWKLDFRKFLQYLVDKYQVTKAYLFIGQVAGNEALYLSLQEYGYKLVFKPTLEHVVDNKKVTKGNIDAELVLHSMIQFRNYDQAIIVSGDGDFYCLIEHLDNKKKLLNIITPNKHYSSLLRKYSKYIVRIDWMRNSLELKRNKKTGISGRSKP